MRYISDQPNAKHQNVALPNVPNYIALVFKAKTERIMKADGTSERDVHMHVVWSYGQWE